MSLPYLMMKVTIQDKENLHQVQKSLKRAMSGLTAKRRRVLSTVLLFAKALKTNAGNEVKAAIQDIVLYLDSHGLPTYVRRTFMLYLTDAVSCNQ